MSMKALSVQAKQDMPLINLVRPTPGENEVLVAVEYCGICGSDFPRYFDGAVHSFPQTLGHEFSGVIEEVGGGVSDLQVGQCVVVAPLVPCHQCQRCKAGKPSLCANYSFIGSRQQGALAQYVLVPARNVLILPDRVSLRDAALVEPLSVALHGISLARYSGVENVVVFGAGVIGLLTVMALKAQGIKQVVAVDVQPRKLDLALELGADDAVLGSEVDAVFKKRQRPQVSIETAGHPTSQVQAIKNTEDNGQIIFVGTCTREVSFLPEEFERILRGELTLRGSWMSYSDPFPGAEWDQAIQLISDGSIKVDRLISREYSLEDGASAFTDVVEAHGELLKVLYHVGVRK